MRCEFVSYCFIPLFQQVTRKKNQKSAKGHRVALNERETVFRSIHKVTERKTQKHVSPCISFNLQLINQLFLPCLWTLRSVAIIV